MNSQQDSGTKNNSSFNKTKSKQQDKRTKAFDKVKKADYSTSSAATNSKKKRGFTLSIVVPSSVVQNAQSQELKAYLVCQIARAAAIFCVDEIIILADEKNLQEKGSVTEFFAINLQYLETPQYLRKALFPVCPELRLSGLMNPLEAPHHLRANEWFEFREGVVIKRPSKETNGSWVNIGLMKDCQIDVKLPENTRVTVRLHEADFISDKFYNGTAVSPEEVRNKHDLYWGYTVRAAYSMDEVFSQGPYQEGYDLKIGVNEPLADLNEYDFAQYTGFKHGLVFFGGIEGIEGVVDQDEYSRITPDETKKMFDVYLNTSINKGSRRVRTEEALLISLAALSPVINSIGLSI